MTVRMVRPDDGKTGDIHPDEVAHMELYGWVVVDETPEPEPEPEPEPDADAGASANILRAAKGPGGRWYVKRGKEIVTGPYGSEDEAGAAAEREPD